MTVIEMFSWFDTGMDEFIDGEISTIQELWNSRKKHSSLKRFENLNISSFKYIYFRDVDTLGHSELFRMRESLYYSEINKVVW